MRTPTIRSPDSVLTRPSGIRSRLALLEARQLGGGGSSAPERSDVLARRSGRSAASGSRPARAPSGSSCRAGRKRPVAKRRSKLASPQREVGAEEGEAEDRQAGGPQPVAGGAAARRRRAGPTSPLRARALGRPALRRRICASNSVAGVAQLRVERLADPAALDLLVGVGSSCGGARSPSSSSAQPAAARRGCRRAWRRSRRRRRPPRRPLAGNRSTQTLDALLAGARGGRSPRRRAAAGRVSARAGPAARRSAGRARSSVRRTVTALLASASLAPWPAPPRRVAPRRPRSCAGPCAAASPARSGTSIR